LEAAVNKIQVDEVEQVTIVQAELVLLSKAAHTKTVTTMVVVAAVAGTVVVLELMAVHLWAAAVVVLDMFTQ
jgi:hypothetical protein